MTSDYRVGRGVQKSDVAGLKRVGRSKISKNRRTSIMDVPLGRLEILYSGKQ